MSDLLAIGRSGVLAYRDALSAVGENVANANTDGFSRRQVNLAEQTETGGPMFGSRNQTVFNGVQSATVTRAWDQYKAANAWSSNSDASYASTRSQYLQTVQTTLDDTDSGIGTKLTAVFTSATQLAANPTDTTLRQSMVYALQDAVGSLGQASATLGKVSGTLAQQAGSGVDQLNTALINLSRTNVALRSSPQGTSGRAALEDQRDALIGTISGFVGVDVTLDQYGAASLTMNDFSGPPLIASGAQVPAIVNMSQASDGRIALTLTGGGVTSAVTATSGSIAAIVDSSNTVADRSRQLDGIASDLATGLNTWQAQGTDLAGAAGTPLLTGTTAQTLALATTDPAKIAAADATGANGNLLALSALRGPQGVEATWHGVVNDSSLQTQAAITASSTASTAKDAAYSAMDSVSGVDLDTEAAELLRYQQAYNASAKIIQAARDTFQSILQLF